MQNDPSIQINTLEDGEVTIRHGQALPLPQPQRVEITGQITAPANWWKGKVNTVKDIFTAYAHVKVDRYAKRITLTTNEEQIEYGGETITGVLKEDPHLARFNINNPDRTWTAKELHSFLKMNRILFADREDNMRICKELLEFKGKATTIIESRDDLRGNSLHVVEKQMQSEFDLQFTLASPVYQGQEKFVFPVEIRFEIMDKSVRYWMESPDLKEIMDDQVEKIIEEQLKSFEGLTVIEV